jgi:transglutaminase-like putative cysteine protease
MNRKVYVISFLLIVIAVALMVSKVIYGGYRIVPGENQGLWRVSIVMHLTGKGDAVRVKLFLPQDTARQHIYNRHFDNGGLDFAIQDRARGNRVGIWHALAVEGVRQIRCVFSAQTRSESYSIPTDLKVPKDPVNYYPPELQPWLDKTKLIQTKDKLVTAQLRELIGKKKNVDLIVKRIYDFVREEVKYESEKSSRDAKKTLEELVADCGGKARLFCAMNRAAGIPCRVVGGIILEKSAKKITHVWAESYIGDKWIPFDVVNGYFASVPAHYLEIYRGDNYLIGHIGLSSLEWIFIIDKANVPPLDYKWSLYVLPGNFQNTINALLLIPLGALIMVFCRNVIGINTFGTFGPMLLALSFREISLNIGLLVLGSIIVLGWVLRAVLDKLKVLLIPKLAVILSSIIVLILFILVAGYHGGEKGIYYITLFPLVILTWLIERFAISQVEDGTKTALLTLLGTIIVGIVIYFAMKIHVVEVYLFAFPELLLIIISILLLLGRYTGIRVLEIWRFRELLMKVRKR